MTLQAVEGLRCPASRGSRWRRRRARDLARPRAGRPGRDPPDARRAHLGLDGARRLARRGRHPRRGRAPGVAARPDLPPRACGGPVDAAVMERAGLDDPAAAAAERIAAVAGAGGHIALTGGSTPRAAYELAAAHGPRLVGRTLWFGDERCVAPDDERSNYGMARVRSARPPLRTAAASCTAWRVNSARTRRPSHTSRSCGRRSATDRGLISCCSASGPDAHCASLFPNAPALDERRPAGGRGGAVPGLAPLRAEGDADAAGPQRRAAVIFLVAGADKAGAVARAFGGEPDPAHRQAWSRPPTAR